MNSADSDHDRSFIPFTLVFPRRPSTDSVSLLSISSSSTMGSSSCNSAAERRRQGFARRTRTSMLATRRLHQIATLNPNKRNNKNRNRGVCGGGKLQRSVRSAIAASGRSAATGSGGGPAATTTTTTNGTHSLLLGAQPPRKAASNSFLASIGVVERRVTAPRRDNHSNRSPAYQGLVLPTRKKSDPDLLGSVRPKAEERKTNNWSQQNVAFLPRPGRRSLTENPPSPARPTTTEDMMSIGSANTPIISSLSNLKLSFYDKNNNRDRHETRWTEASAAGTTGPHSRGGTPPTPTRANVTSSSARELLVSCSFPALETTICKQHQRHRRQGTAGTNNTGSSSSAEVHPAAAAPTYPTRN